MWYSIKFNWLLVGRSDKLIKTTRGTCPSATTGEYLVRSISHYLGPLHPLIFIISLFPLPPLPPPHLWLRGRVEINGNMLQFPNCPSSSTGALRHPLAADLSINPALPEMFIVQDWFVFVFYRMSGAGSQLLLRRKEEEEEKNKKKSFIHHRAGIN